MVTEIESDDNKEQNQNDLYEFMLIDKDGEKYERRFEEIELNGLSKVLENKVESSFYDIGTSVSDQEKQQNEGNTQILHKWLH